MLTTYSLFGLSSLLAQVPDPNDCCAKTGGGTPFTQTVTLPGGCDIQVSGCCNPGGPGKPAKLSICYINGLGAWTSPHGCTYNGGIAGAYHDAAAALLALANGPCSGFDPCANNVQCPDSMIVLVTVPCSAIIADSTYYNTTTYGAGCTYFHNCTQYINTNFNIIPCGDMGDCSFQFKVCCDNGSRVVIALPINKGADGGIASCPNLPDTCFNAYQCFGFPIYYVAMVCTPVCEVTALLKTSPIKISPPIKLDLTQIKKEPIDVVIPKNLIKNGKGSYKEKMKLKK